MRAALVGPSYPHRGGIVHYTHSLAAALVEQGVDVELHTYRRLFPRILYKGASYAGPEGTPLPRAVRVHREFTYGNPLSWRHGGRRMAGADVIHFQVWTPFLSPSYRGILREAQKAGLASVATVHNVQPHEGRDRAASFVTHGLLRKCDAVVVHSPSLVAPIVQAADLPPERVHVIPQGVYTQFNKGGLSKQAAREKLGIRGDRRVGILFGMIRPYKGVDVALQALARMPEEYELLVVGEPWEPWARYQRIIEQEKLGGRIHAHLRYVADDEVETFFRAADFALLPYREFESQSAAALTAIGFGLPLIASKVGGLVDLPALHVPPGDPEAVARAMAELADDPGFLPGKAAGWTDVAKMTVQLYETLEEAH